MLSACEPLDDETDTDTDTTTDTTSTEVTEDDADGSTSTGSPADYDSFSLAVDDAVVSKALNTDGITATFTVQVGDRFNKAVDDATVVYFWAENGILQTNFCLTSSGSCSVVWVSGGTRPADGLATILAYAVGEDSYIESGQANGIYNVASDTVGNGGVALALNEVLLSTPEAYKDYNYDGYTSANFTDLATNKTVPSDAFLDYNKNGSYDASSSKFRGEDCSSAAQSAGHCAQSSVYVWDMTQIAWGPSYSAPIVTIDDMVWNDGDTINVTVTDYLGNTPASGTGISVSSDNTDFSVNFPNGEEVPTYGEAGNWGYNFQVYVVDAGGVGSATIEIDYEGSTYTYNVTTN